MLKGIPRGSSYRHSKEGEGEGQKELVWKGPGVGDAYSTYDVMVGEGRAWDGIYLGGHGDSGAIGVNVWCQGWSLHFCVLQLGTLWSSSLLREKKKSAC